AHGVSLCKCLGALRTPASDPVGQRIGASVHTQSLATRSLRDADYGEESSMEYRLLDRRDPLVAHVAELLAGGPDGRARAIQGVREGAGGGAGSGSTGGGPHGPRPTEMAG